MNKKILYVFLTINSVNLLASEKKPQRDHDRHEESTTLAQPQQLAHELMARAQRQTSIDKSAYELIAQAMVLLTKAQQKLDESRQEGLRVQPTESKGMVAASHLLGDKSRNTNVVDFTSGHSFSGNQPAKWITPTLHRVVVSRD